MKFEDISSNFWCVALGRCDREDLEAAVELESERYLIRRMQLSESGLYLLQMADSVQGDPFILADVPVSMASVGLYCREEDDFHLGTAVIMRDDPALAEYIAVGDAVLRNRLEGWESWADLVEIGMIRLNQTRNDRRGILARSRVDLSMLSQAGESEEELD